MEHVSGNRVRIFDANGHQLAEGEAAPSAAPETFDLSAGQAGELMAYYFGRNGRAVTIELGGLRREGRLDTAWGAGRRKWLVRINQAATGDSASVDPLVAVR